MADFFGQRFENRIQYFIRLFAVFFHQQQNHKQDRDCTKAEIAAHSHPIRERKNDNSQRHYNEQGKDINDALYDGLRMNILKAPLYILTADGNVDAREEEMLEKIRKGLGYSKKKLDRAKEKFLAERNLQSSS